MEGEGAGAGDGSQGGMAPVHGAGGEGEGGGGNEPLQSAWSGGAREEEARAGATEQVAEAPACAPGHGWGVEEGEEAEAARPEGDVEGDPGLGGVERRHAPDGGAGGGRHPGVREGRVGRVDDQGVLAGGARSARPVRGEGEGAGAGRGLEEGGLSVGQTTGERRVDVGPAGGEGAVAGLARAREGPAEAGIELGAEPGEPHLAGGGALESVGSGTHLNG